MKVSYKGYEIAAERDKEIDGGTIVFYGIYDKYGFEILSNYNEDSNRTIRSFIKELKTDVDEIIKEDKAKEEYRRGRMIQEFISQNEIDENSLKYDAGCVHKVDDNYVIAFNQLGAEITFSIGQPIYDTNKNKLGYLGIGLYNNLNYTNHSHNIDIPCYYWMICNPTQYCKDGIIIHTYWQNLNKSVKEHNED